MLTAKDVAAIPLFLVLPISEHVASAVGEGSMAIALVHQYLAQEW
jgi:hypothetical protein